MKKQKSGQIHIIPKPIIATRETSKRALFQSPSLEIPKLKVAPEVAIRVEKSKRALFSPPRRLEHSKSSQSLYKECKGFPYGSTHCLNRTVSDVSINLKRRRENDDENIEPRAAKMHKSQTMGGSNGFQALNSVDFNSSSSLNNTSSDNLLNVNQQLSASHKQVGQQNYLFHIEYNLNLTVCCCFFFSSRNFCGRFRLL